MAKPQPPAPAGLDLDAVGRKSEPSERSWSSRDSLLYAVGVGTGQEDPTTELAFTTENSEGVEQQVLPTFAVLLGMEELPPIGNVDVSQLLHAEQGLTLHRSLPTEGRVRSASEVTGIYDKGTGALVTVRSEIRSADGGAELATLTTSFFVRGAGGFDGERGPSSNWEVPEAEPDATVSFLTSPGQALLYRLSGDRNPLHSDPRLAGAAGFPRPILHGLCTYGYAGRALLAEVCDGDPARFGGISARFSKPVLPGQRLDVAIWRQDGGARFQTSTPEGGVVLDRGRFEIARS